MGKKMKKKAPNPRKAALLQRAPAVPVLSRSIDRKAEAAVSDEGERGSTEACSHYSRSLEELNKILSSIRSNSSHSIPCEHCREETGNKWSSEKGKQPKKKKEGKASKSKKESNFVWICLDCNRSFCGGEVSVSEPYGHARRHSKQEHHAWAVLSDNPLISWCYLCKSSIPIEIPEEGVDKNPKPAMDSEDAVESLALQSSKGYVVRGLSNLGNTCFFNSVMQNLFATDMLRNYMLSLDRPVGSITMTLKKLFIEMSCSVDSKNILSPKALFGSISVKAPQFRGYQQQDSHELLHYLLDGLHVEEMSTRDEQETNRGVTFVDAIFGGQTSSTVCCMECGHLSVVHEPFLDLSLPVPSKKIPPKRGPPPPPKRKPPLKERNKGRRFREKVVAKAPPVVKHSNEQSSGVPSVCSESSAVAKVEDDFTWLDFCEVPQSESFDQGTLDSQLVNCSREFVVSSDSCGETSCVQDSNALILTDKEQDPTAEEINGTASCSQTAENDPDFDGFGDLFTEPEVASAPKAENGTGEDLDVSLWTGNISESNHNEVDDTNSPVSINRCLALFTKPEILSNDQAWYCERCSENFGQRKANLKAVEALDKAESNPEVSSSSVEVDSKESGGSGEKKKSFSSKNAISQGDRLHNPSEDSEILQNDKKMASCLENVVSQAEIFDSAYPLETLQKVKNNAADPLEILHNDESGAASDNSSNYLTCPLADENTMQQEDSNYQENESCRFYNQEAVCSGDDITSVLCKNEGKEAMQLLDKKHSLNSNGSEEVESKTKKVKRDATKRILIYRIPPVLTIHLKRFSQDGHGRLTKLRGHVSFQETIDLRPYMDPGSEEKGKCEYRLIGVVEHSGSMSGGHYIAYIRGERGPSKTQKEGGPAWFYASDAHVREASLSEVLRSDAYILFYERIQS